MSPPISKDWWLAAALTSATLPAAMAQPAPQPVAASAPGASPVSYTVRQGDTLTRIGAEQGLDWRDLALWNNITNPDVIPVGLVLRLTPPDGVTTSARARASVVSPSARGARKPPIYVTETRGQRITTGPGETTHVLFSDQSAITVGPNSEVVIAEYQYTPPPPSVTPAAALQPQLGTGQLLLQMPRGILRVVGGLLSKRTATLVKTPTATIGIRGGISIVEHNEQGATNGTFLFGDEMQATQDSTGRSEKVFRPGFGVTVTATEFRGPERTSKEELARQLAQVQAEEQPTGQAGETPDPNATRQVNNTAPDRVTGPEGVAAPNLADLLGSQAPGNQS